MKYEPRAAFMPFHLREKRWSCIVAHRRAGKTVACINELLTRALATKKENARYAYIAPFYGQAKQIAWDYLKAYGREVIVKIHESELQVELFNGSRIRLFGADSPDALRGMYFDGVILDEYADMRPSVWPEIVRPALTDRRGWAVFIGTPKGENEFYKIYTNATESDDWYSLVLKASKSGLLPSEELYDARKTMTEDQYAQEFECSFTAAIVGAYYGEAIRKLEDAGQVGDFQWLPELAVHTIWDTGGTTACWFVQLDGSKIRVIEYLEGHNKNAAHYVNELRSRPYTYGTHIGPSDADEEKEIVGKSWKTSFEELGLYGWEILPKQKSKQDGINQAQLLIPRCQFNTSGVRHSKDGVAGLKNYRREWDENRKKFKDEPRHDWASHPADGFRYLAVGLPLLTNQGHASDWSKPLSYTNRVI